MLSLPHEAFAKVFVKIFQTVHFVSQQSSFSLPFGGTFTTSSCQAAKEPVPAATGPWGTLNWFLAIHMKGRAQLNTSKLTSIACS